MEAIKIKANLDEKKLEALGYRYNIMEAGYISNDGATVISIERRPYQRQVMQFKPNAKKEHENNVKELRENNLLEE